MKEPHGRRRGKEVGRDPSLLNCRLSCRPSGVGCDGSAPVTHLIGVYMELSLGVSPRIYLIMGGTYVCRPEKEWLHPFSFRLASVEPRHRFRSIQHAPSGRLIGTYGMRLFLLYPRPAEGILSSSGRPQLCSKNCLCHPVR